MKHQWKAESTKEGGGIFREKVDIVEIIHQTHLNENCKGDFEEGDHINPSEIQKTEITSVKYISLENLWKVWTYF